MIIHFCFTNFHCNEYSASILSFITNNREHCVINTIVLGMCSLLFAVCLVAVPGLEGPWTAEAKQGPDKARKTQPIKTIDPLLYNPLFYCYCNKRQLASIVFIFLPRSFGRRPSVLDVVWQR